MGKYIGYCVYRRSYLLLPPVTQTTRKNAPYPTYEYHIPAKHEWVLMYRRYIIDVDARRTLHALLLQEPARYLYLSQPPPTLTTSLRLLHLLLNNSGWCRTAAVYTGNKRNAVRPRTRCRVHLVYLTSIYYSEYYYFSCHPTTMCSKHDLQHGLLPYLLLCKLNMYDAVPAREQRGEEISPPPVIFSGEKATFVSATTTVSSLKNPLKHQNMAVHRVFKLSNFGTRSTSSIGVVPKDTRSICCAALLYTRTR